MQQHCTDQAWLSCGHRCRLTCWESVGSPWSKRKLHTPTPPRKHALQVKAAGEQLSVKAGTSAAVTVIEPRIRAHRAVTTLRETIFSLLLHILIPFPLLHLLLLILCLRHRLHLRLFLFSLHYPLLPLLLLLCSILLRRRCHRDQALAPTPCSHHLFQPGPPTVSIAQPVPRSSLSSSSYYGKAPAPAPRSHHLFRLLSPLHSQRNRFDCPAGASRQRATLKSDRRAWPSRLTPARRVGTLVNVSLLIFVQLVHSHQFSTSTR